LSKFVTFITVVFFAYWTMDCRRQY